ncbi:hypothetical protein NDK43_07665 [Neobacillus pocheonensis]|uniref:DUF4386 domain-containing protein n=1 Tax=Neobacillus pocheonensis TaxID=363869 RepID=A0ABT0W7K2_9BACI|nr:hypothetical protein [Neobacillus pocheonensis]
MSKTQFRILTAICGLVGCIILITSFIINPAPPSTDTITQLIVFGNEHHNIILMAGWLQTVGTLLLVLFAIAIVHVAGATTRFSGWFTMFGGIVLMMVSVIEVIFYINFLTSTVSTLLENLNLIRAVQHAFSMVAAPIIFLPLGTVILGSRVLPQVFGYLALLLGVAFSIFGMVCLFGPFQYVVDYLAMGQGGWWLLAAITLLVQKETT